MLSLNHIIPFSIYLDRYRLCQQPGFKFTQRELEQNWLVSEPRKLKTSTSFHSGVLMQAMAPKLPRQVLCALHNESSDEFIT